MMKIPTCVGRGILYCHVKSPHCVFISDNFMIIVIVEMDSKSSGQHIEMGEFRIGRIIAHQYQHPARFYPVVDAAYPCGIWIMGRRHLPFVIRIDNDIDARMLQIIRRRRHRQAIGMRPILPEQLPSSENPLLALSSHV